MYSLDANGVLRVPEFEALPWLTAGFGTRHADEWMSRQSLTTVKQIHSDRVLVADGRSGWIGEGDALVSRTPGQLLAIRTADCVPALVVDLHRHAVAAVHAGWRGTVAEILPKTLEKMHAEYGTELAGIRVALGPCIQECCFEVGPEVAHEFSRWFPERDDLNRKTNLDLIETNRRQLLAAGLAPSQIVASSDCTFCQPEQYHSFRRDREDSGRLVAFAGVME